ncbi:MAG TPA: nuclear transport factor 2 family protein [Chryseosolibacter sp.]
MKHTALLIMIFMASCDSTYRTANVEEEIIALARQRSKAVVEGDINTLERILSPDFTYVNTSGKLLSRKAYLDSQVALGATPNSRWISQSLDSVTVKVLNSSVLITFRVKDRFIYENIEYSNDCRSTFLYQREAGSWKCVMGQTTEFSTE